MSWTLVWFQGGNDYVPNPSYLWGSQGARSPSSGYLASVQLCWVGSHLHQAQVQISGTCKRSITGQAGVSSSWHHQCFEGVLRSLPFLDPLQGQYSPCSMQSALSLGVVWRASRKGPGQWQGTRLLLQLDKDEAVCTKVGWHPGSIPYFRRKVPSLFMSSIGEAEGMSSCLSQQEEKNLRVTPPSQPAVEHITLHGPPAVISIQDLLAYTKISTCNTGGEKTVLSHSLKSPVAAGQKSTLWDKQIDTREVHYRALEDMLTCGCKDSCALCGCSRGGGKESCVSLQLWTLRKLLERHLRLFVFEVMSSTFMMRSARSRYRNHCSSVIFRVLPMSHFVSPANLVFKIIINTGDGAAGDQPLSFSWWHLVSYPLTQPSVFLPCPLTLLTFNYWSYFWLICHAIHTQSLFLFLTHSFRFFVGLLWFFSQLSVSFPCPNIQVQPAGEGAENAALTSEYSLMMMVVPQEPKYGSSTGQCATLEAPWRPPPCVFSRKSLVALQEPYLGLVSPAQLGLGGLSMS